MVRKKLYLKTPEGIKWLPPTGLLYKLPEGITYKDLLPCTRNYNAYNSGYNSRDRMGLSLFKKITRAYLSVQFEKLLEGKKIVFPCRAPLQMALMQVKDYGFNTDDKIRGLRLVIWSYNGQSLVSYGYCMTNKLKGLIRAKIESGIIYPKKLRNARKHKVLYG